MSERCPCVMSRQCSAAGRISFAKVNIWREKALLQRRQRERGFDGACRAQGMTGHAFRAADGCGWAKIQDGFPFAGIIKRCAGSMGVDIINLACRNPGILESFLHGLLGPRPEGCGWVRWCVSMALPYPVSCKSVSLDCRQNIAAPSPRARPVRCASNGRQTSGVDALRQIEPRKKPARRSHRNLLRERDEPRHRGLTGAQCPRR